MKELIEVLKYVLAFAEGEGKLDAPSYAVVRTHITALEKDAVACDAIDLIRQLQRDGQPIRPDCAAGTLARVCMMLALYGSKSDAILAVIHDKGYEDIRLCDVEAVRNFILQQ